MKLSFVALKGPMQRFPHPSCFESTLHRRTIHTMKHHRISLFFGWVMLGLVYVGNAQITGYTVELDTVFGDIQSSDPLAQLAYHGVYNIYANFTSPEDVLSALYSRNDSIVETPPMGIDAPCGCFNPSTSPMVLDPSNNEALFGAFPEYEFDSFRTLDASTIAPATSTTMGMWRSTMCC